MVEPRMLRYERTDYGRAIRKQYEAGEVQEKIGNMRQPKSRPDFVANTLTGVLKDNYLLEPINWAVEFDVDRNKKFEKEREISRVSGYTVNDFFCGAGGMGLGFKQAGFEIVGAWDFDKYAVQSYRHNIGDHVKQADISKMTYQDVPTADVWTFGFPCQDLSVAGRQAGMIKGKTRSGLFYEVMRLLAEVQENVGFEAMPKVIMAENVKGLKPYLGVLEEEYKAVGYKMYYTLYNSKYWGVPQNRERYFVVGVREDIAKKLEFVYPIEQKEFVPRLSSALEANVDEKYYVSSEKATVIIEQAKEGLKVREAVKAGYSIAKVGDTINLNFANSKTRRGRIGKQIAQTLMTETEQVVVESLGGVHACMTPEIVNKKQNGRRAKEEEAEMFTLTAQDRHGVIVAGRLDIKGHDLIKRVYDTEGVAPTLTAVKSGSQEAKILERAEGDQIIVAGSLKPDGCTRLGQRDVVWDARGVGGSVCASDWKQPRPVLHDYRVRKLTPREYARLQGFPDWYEIIVSNSQAYKQFGNAVTVKVSEALATAIISFLDDVSEM